MKIPKELTPIIYELSKKVFEGQLTQKEGQQQIVGDNRINSNSAADYIYVFCSMLEGNKFTRTINAYSMEYFLENIYKDYGSTGLSKALTAFRLHIEYYEDIQKKIMYKMRRINEKYLTMSIDSPDELEQKEIIRMFKNGNKTRQEIIFELNNLKPSDHEKVTLSLKSFKRDNHTIAQLKIIRDFKCQICSTSIKKKDGTYYIEAAHIEPKSKKGRETPENILILCPNHHKEFDFGNRNILEHNKEKINFILNEQEYFISLKIE